MASSFGEALREKRRSLGLSIQQVANTIKIRPQIVEYFELGDFAQMPPRGYAQGMISSYARFLGLNPRDIVNMYLDELYVYERSGDSPVQQYQEPASFVSSRSDSSAGRFMIVDGGAPSSSRYAQRPPQAGYVSDSTTGHSSLRVGSNPRRRQALLANTSTPSDDQPGQMRSRSQSGSTRRREPGGSGNARHPRSQDPRNRRSSSGSGARRNQPSRNRAGRTPNGRPINGSACRNNGYGRSNSVSRTRGGVRHPQSGFNAFLNSVDPRFLLVGAGIVLLLIVLLLVSAIRGCTSSSQSSSASQAAGSTEVSASSTSKSSTSSTKSSSSSKKTTNDDSSDSDDVSSDTSTDASSSSDSDTSSDTSADDASDSSFDSSTTTRVTTVKISLAKGKTSWIEVKVDGVSQYADTPVGPYEAEYTPTKSISITVDNPSAVTVTENGSKVRWDSKTSGVGRVTIAVEQTSSDSSVTDTDSSDSSDTQDDSTDSSSD